jgi:hypothetical protein
MAEEERRSGIWGFVVGVLAETKGKAQKTLASSIVAGAVVVLAAIVAWVRGSEAVQLVLFGSIGTVLLWFVVLGGIGLWRYLRRKPPEPPPATALADPESVRRLQEVFTQCKPALLYAAEYLQADFCLGASNGERRIISALLQECVLRGYADDRYMVEVLLGVRHRPLTQTEFDELLSRFAQLVSVRYLALLGWITQVGLVFLGSDRLLSSDGYAGLYRRHADLLRAINQVSERTDLSGLASWHRTLSDALPPTLTPQLGPSVDPPPSKASEQAPLP